MCNVRLDPWAWCAPLESGRVWVIVTFGGAFRDGLAAFWAWVRNDLGTE